MAFVSGRDNYQIVPPPTQFGTSGCNLGIKSAEVKHCASLCGN